jgi:secreted trypsin-like serine protease
MINCVAQSSSRKMLITNLSLILLSVLNFTVAGVLNSECGVKAYSSGLILGGSISKTNDWPWLAALIVLKSNQYFCCGSIISKNHILTAAHCIQPKGNSSNHLKASDIIASLGRHNLKVPLERDAQNFDPTKIHIHPDWNIDSERYDSDIAILYSEISIRFRNGKISPVCIWQGTNQIEDDIELTAVGWGKSITYISNVEPHSDEPIQVQIKTVDKITCLQNDSRIADLSSKKLFCATGVVSGSGPCTGDSGD